MRVSAGLVCLCLLAGTGSANAQNMGWYISGDFVWMTTRGNDVHVGDVITGEQTSSGPVTNFVGTETRTVTPIVPEMGTEPTVLIEGGFRGPTWGFGARTWWVETDGSVGETVRSATSTPPTFRATTVNMFNESFFPFDDNREPTGLGPITYAADNTLKNVRVDGWAERLWISGPMGTVAMRFGVGYAKVENTRTDTLSQTGRAAAGVNTFHDDESAVVESTSSASLVGPSFGIAGDMLFGKVEINWLVSPMALIGSTETDITGTTTGIFRTTTTATGATTALSTFTSTTSGTDDRNTIVPTVDLQLRAGVAVLPALTVGGGILSSTMFNLPVAPTVDFHNDQWVDQNRTVTFLGYSVFARFRF